MFFAQLIVIIMQNWLFWRGYSTSFLVYCFLENSVKTFNIFFIKKVLLYLLCTLPYIMNLIFSKFPKFSRERDIIFIGKVRGQKSRGPLEKPIEMAD
jgi:hypothetical protein